MDRTNVLLVGATAEVLPKRILDPARHQRFARLVERVFEFVQADQLRELKTDLEAFVDEES